MPQRIPVRNGISLGVAAGDSDVVTVPNSLEQFRQCLRWMLKIGIHHAEKRSIRVLPSMEDGTRKASRASTDNQANARIAPRKFVHDIGGSIPAVIVHDQKFVIEINASQSNLYAIEKDRNVPGFI